ncbi:MAG: hypothetical protein U0P45_04200 [Acidimicrobiales bacterium]
MTEEIVSGLPPLGPDAKKVIVGGCLIGVVVSFVSVTLGMHALGADWAPAVGLGLFVGFWGGLGFGAMVGGVVYAAKLERHTEEEARTTAPERRPIDLATTADR